MDSPYPQLTSQFVRIQEGEIEIASAQSPAEFPSKPYQAALKGDWKKVEEFFGKHQNQLTTPATGIGNTLLHLALHSQKEEPLKTLLGHLNNVETVLGSIKNEYGNTLLDEAAITGNLEAAKILVGKRQDLLFQKNKFGETPLFRAASFGRNEMVEFLAEEAGQTESHNGQQLLPKDHSIRNDQTSILHAAVRGEHYETALLLLKLDKSLANLKDHKFKTALQLLAETPSAFQSGCSMGILKQLLYDCLLVEDEEEDDDDEDFSRSSAQPEDPERGRIGKQSSHNFGFLGNGCKGWPLLNNFWQTKRKHTFAFRLAKKLIKKDDNFWNQKVVVDIDSNTGFYIVKASSDEPNGGKDAGKGKGVEKKLTTPIQLFLQTFRGAVKIGKEMLKGYPMAVEHIDHMKDQVLKVALNESNDDEEIPEAPLLIATRNGIKEIVVEILKEYPQAAELINKKGQNILHLAIRHRQEEIFNIVSDMGIMLLQTLTRGIDFKGCNLLHYVADTHSYVRGKKAGPALELQEELKWFERVKQIIPPYYVSLANQKNGLTANAMFDLTHKKQLDDAITWIKETSQPCSTVSVLVATVVFAAAYTVPGGYEKGVPVFLHSPYFRVFSIMDVISLACSLTAVVMFLSVLTSTFEMHEFRHTLPRRLMWGLTLLFLSVLTTMIAFAATILLTINLEKKWTTGLITIAAFVPVSVFVLMQFQLYFSFLGAVWEFWKEIKNALPLCGAGKPLWN